MVKNINTYGGDNEQRVVDKNTLFVLMSTRVYDSKSKV